MTWATEKFRRKVERKQTEIDVFFYYLRSQNAWISRGKSRRIFKIKRTLRNPLTESLSCLVSGCNAHEHTPWIILTYLCHEHSKWLQAGEPATINPKYVIHFAHALCPIILFPCYTWWPNYIWHKNRKKTSPTQSCANGLEGRTIFDENVEFTKVGTMRLKKKICRSKIREQVLK